MRPLSFCHVTTFYPPYNFGGDGIGIQRLVRALARRGHRNTVVHDVDAFEVLAKGRDPGRGVEPPGVEVIGLRSGVGPVSPLLTQQFGRPLVTGGKLARLLARGDFDVINFHNVSLVGGPGVLALGEAVKLYMAHEHWLVCESHVLWRHNRELCDKRECLRCVLNFGRPPQLWRSTGLLSRMARHVDAFIAMSEFSRDKHREFGFKRPMEVVNYFLPDPEADAGPSGPREAEAPPPHPRPYFLFVGRLEKIKGLDDVIPLFREFDGADLLIAGDGEYGSALRALAGDNPRVRFLGRVPVDELSRYYRGATALIVPSICFETFGIILIEAFRSRTPVIARRIGPFPEIIRRARSGELFQTKEELLDAMRRMLGDPEARSRAITSGHAAYLEHWSESAVVPRYLDVIARAALAKDTPAHRRVRAALDLPTDPPPSQP
ncbi:MAG: glycosyltransferase family 4 protein [Planctomycetes bacterium]|nr:glycosyltransferase family 4 protein [Planctomycetota bacterium]